MEEKLVGLSDRLELGMDKQKHLPGMTWDRVK